MESWLLFFVVVVGVPVVVTALVDVYKRHMKLQERRLELEAATGGERAVQNAQRIERLEARVAVLERIAIDPATRLDREIAALDAPVRH